MFNFIIKLIDQIVWPLLIVLLIWIAFFVNHGYSLDLNYFGMRPHELRGLIGIFTMPFLHGNFEHLFSNTLPLLVSLSFMFHYFDKLSWKIILSIWLITGTLLFFMGDEGSNHIGASGLVYGYIAFLVTHAFLNKNKHSIAASLILVFLYGSLIYGLFPEYGRLIGKNISWEGHLSGAIAGVLMAFVYRKQGPQKIEYFEDENDDDLNDLGYDPEWFDHEDFRINYHYRKPTDES